MFAKINMTKGGSFLSDGGCMLLELTLVAYGGTGRNVKVYGNGFQQSYIIEFATEQDASKFVDDLDKTGRAEATALLRY